MCRPIAPMSIILHCAPALRAGRAAGTTWSTCTSHMAQCRPGKAGDAGRVVRKCAPLLALHLKAGVDCGRDKRSALSVGVEGGVGTACDTARARAEQSSTWMSKNQRTSSGAVASNAASRADLSESGGVHESLIWQPMHGGANGANASSSRAARFKPCNAMSMQCSAFSRVQGLLLTGRSSYQVGLHGACMQPT